MTSSRNTPVSEFEHQMTTERLWLHRSPINIGYTCFVKGEIPFEFPNLITAYHTDFPYRPSARGYSWWESLRYIKVGGLVIWFQFQDCLFRVQNLSKPCALSHILAAASNIWHIWSRNHSNQNKKANWANLVWWCSRKSVWNQTKQTFPKRTENWESICQKHTCYNYASSSLCSGAALSCAVRGLIARCQSQGAGSSNI